MESIRILNRIEPKKPILLAAWPGMGNVAYGAAIYLIESLHAQKFAEIAIDDVFYKTGVQVQNGTVDIPDFPKSDVFYYSNPHGEHDLIIYTGESQPIMEKEYELAKRVVELARSYGVYEIMTFAATPVNITHRADPKVWCVATDKDILLNLQGLSVKVMSSGHIGGLNGLLLGVGKEAGIRGICFLGEIPFYTAKIENPKASYAILKVFIRYTGIEVDLSSLIQMSRYVEQEIERVSKTTKQTLFGDNIPREHVSEDETQEESLDEKKESIPGEARQRIEYLFAAADKDISKAGELKEELDRWGLFQEYEDRFLDLFGNNNF